MTGAVLEWSRAYVMRGFRVVPVPAGEKGSRHRAWENLNLRLADLPNYFGANNNIGVILGPASGELVDADLDCIEALELADYGDTPAAMMLIDRAVSAYQDFMRVTGWVGNLALHIEHEFFGRDGPGAQFRDQRLILKEVVEAQRHGIIFDCAHGRSHFSFPMIEKALDQGFLPDTISTDLQAQHCHSSQDPRL